MPWLHILLWASLINKEQSLIPLWNVPLRSTTEAFCIISDVGSSQKCDEQKSNKNITWHSHAMQANYYTHFQCSCSLQVKGHCLIYFWQMAWNFEDLQDNFILKYMGNYYPCYCKSCTIEKMSWTFRGPAKTLHFDCHVKLFNSYKYS